MYPDCSRFWECGPAYETCLFECAACPCLQFPEQENDPQCNFQCEGKDGWQWANTFDEKWVLISKRIWTSLQECDEFVRFHFWPEGPTCVWPINYNGTCSNLGPDCDCLPWQVRMKKKVFFSSQTFLDLRKWKVLTSMRRRRQLPWRLRLRRVWLVISSVLNTGKLSRFLKVHWGRHWM